MKQKQLYQYGYGTIYREDRMNDEKTGSPEFRQ